MLVEDLGRYRGTVVKGRRWGGSSYGWRSSEIWEVVRLIFFRVVPGRFSW